MDDSRDLELRADPACFAWINPSQRDLHIAEHRNDLEFPTQSFDTLTTGEIAWFASLAPAP